MSAIVQALRDMLGHAVGLGIADPQAPPTGLWPVEQSAMSRATETRQREFAAGRRAARQAMVDLGVPKGAISVGTDRAPVWPDNLLGSISHCETQCIAAAASKANLSSLGIDIEPATPLARDLHDIICTQAERDWLAGQPKDTRDLSAKMIFCAKEAVYKAQYPLTKTGIGFDAVKLCIASSGQFDITYLKEFSVPLPQSGQIQIIDGMIVSVVYRVNAP